MSSEETPHKPSNSLRNIMDAFRDREWGPADMVHLYQAGNITGVIFPRKNTINVLLNGVLHNEDGPAVIIVGYTEYNPGLSYAVPVHTRYYINGLIVEKDSFIYEVILAKDGNYEP